MLVFFLKLLQAASLRLAVVSDIHISASCSKPSPFNCDTDPSLLTSAFLEISRHSPDLIISVGDEISHNQRNPLQVKSLISYLFETYSTHFPYTPIIHAVGNNDGIFANQPQRDYLDQLAFLYQYWIPNAWKQYSFLQNGYYDLNYQSFKFLVLNTILFLNETEAGYSQLDWVYEEVKASNKDIIIIAHAPPAVSMFNGGEQVWNEKMLERFKKIIQKFNKKVKLVLSGHLHRGTFTTISSVPVLINPALSPIYFTSPSYRIFDLENDSIDYTEYAMNNGTWQPNYRFSEEFRGLNELEKYVRDIEDESEHLDKLVILSRGNLKDCDVDLRSIYEVSTNVKLEIGEMRRIVWCSLNDFSFDEFLECRRVK